MSLKRAIESDSSSVYIMEIQFVDADGYTDKEKWLEGVLSAAHAAINNEGGHNLSGRVRVIYEP